MLQRVPGDRDDDLRDTDDSSQGLQWLLCGQLSWVQFWQHQGLIQDKCWTVGICPPGTSWPRIPSTSPHPCPYIEMSICCSVWPLQLLKCYKTRWGEFIMSAASSINSRPHISAATEMNFSCFILWTLMLNGWKWVVSGHCVSWSCQPSFQWQFFCVVFCCKLLFCCNLDGPKLVSMPPFTESCQCLCHHCLVECLAFKSS